MEKVWHFATLEADETRRSKLAQRDYRLTIGSRDSQTSFDHTRFWQGSALRSGPVWTWERRREAGCLPYRDVAHPCRANIQSHRVPRKALVAWQQRGSRSHSIQGREGIKFVSY